MLDEIAQVSECVDNVPLSKSFVLCVYPDVITILYFSCFPSVRPRKSNDVHVAEVNSHVYT